MDREKVIKGLEELYGFLFREYANISAEESKIYYERTCAIRDALALLKEQEAVEPTIDEYGRKRCGSCGHKLQSIADPDLFCCKCGKPVLWEGR